MESIIEELYETIWRGPCEEPHYQKALKRWEEEAKAVDRLTLEDAVELLEYEWGYSAFAAGIRLGMSLAQELSL